MILLKVIGVNFAKSLQTSFTMADGIRRHVEVVAQIAVAEMDRAYCVESCLQIYTAYHIWTHTKKRQFVLVHAWRCDAQKVAPSFMVKTYPVDLNSQSADQGTLPCTI